jgi:hypothetical protein
MKKFRFYLALGIRIVGYIFSFPTAICNTISDMVKNKEDEFDF